MNNNYIYWIALDPNLPLNRRQNPRAILGMIFLDDSRTGKPHFLKRGEGTLPMFTLSKQNTSGVYFRKNILGN